MRHVILFLAANPSGTDRLALDREARSIREALKRSGHRHRFELETRWAAEPLDLLRELRELKPTVVHFSGHGAPIGAGSPGFGGKRDVVEGSAPMGAGALGLYFQDAGGSAHHVPLGAIVQAFGAAGASVKVVVLSACFSQSIAKALLEHVECVVGMSDSVHDDAARSFATGFYGGLGEHESIAAAFEHGKAAISLAGSFSAEPPKLNVRDGCDASRVILAAGAPASAARPDRTSRHPRLDDDRAGIEADDTELATAWCAMTRLSRIDLERRSLHSRAEFEGKTIGSYLLGRQLGHGGTGVVFRARHRFLRNAVALKLFYPVRGAGRDLLGAVDRSVRGLRSLRHPGIVELLDVGQVEVDDAVAVYLVMELIEGQSLDSWIHALDHSADAMRARLNAAIEIANALQVAHTALYLDELGFAQTSLTHGDVKPSNILVRQSDAQPVLVDFMMPDIQRAVGDTPGISAAIHDLDNRGATSVFGTEDYMPPEQAKSGITLPASDVYSLGMTMIQIFFYNISLIDRSVVIDTWVDHLAPALAHELRDLLSSMIRIKPLDRPTLTSVSSRLREMLDLVP